MKKVRWGVLSTAKIGVKKVIPAMQRGDYCELVAIASRSFEKAQKAATELKIPNAFGSYQELLEDQEIDAVYIPLPNHLHIPWTLKALTAGKHVLCEKPVGLSSSEARELLEAARHYPELKVMEAFMYRFHPQWIRAKEGVQEGAIGELRTINSFFCYFNNDPGNIRNKPEMGGGGLLDIGCYCISLSRFIFGKEPERISGFIEKDPYLAIDRLASGILDFGEGTSTFTCSTQLSPHQRVNIFGTEGQIEIEIPFNAPPDQPTRIWLYSGGRKKEITFDRCNQYTLQGDLFSKAILNNTEVPTPLEDAVENMKAIESLIKSAKENTWIYMNRDLA